MSVDVNMNHLNCRSTAANKRPEWNNWGFFYIKSKLLNFDNDLVTRIIRLANKFIIVVRAWCVSTFFLRLGHGQHGHSPHPRGQPWERLRQAKVELWCPPWRGLSASQGCVCQWRKEVRKKSARLFCRSHNVSKSFSTITFNNFWEVAKWQWTSHQSAIRI